MEKILKENGYVYDEQQKLWLAKEGAKKRIRIENNKKTDSSLYKELDSKYKKIENAKYSNDIEKITYDNNYIPTAKTEYLNCIGFVCYMYNVPASYSVKDFNKYTQFKELSNIKNVKQLEVGDIITWEYESGTFDKENNPIYEYHASIWKGDGKIWECMDFQGVRERKYSDYLNWMNNNNHKIHTIKYFRLKD